MIDPKAKPVRIALLLAPFMTFLLMIAGLVVVYQSYIGYYPPPVTVTNISGQMTVDQNSTSLVYERLASVRVEVSSRISRRIICNDHWIFEFSSSNEEYTNETVGKIHAYHERIPFRIPAGTTCVLNTTAVYHPPLSLRDHTYPVPDIVMTVSSSM